MHKAGFDVQCRDGRQTQNPASQGTPLFGGFIQERAIAWDGVAECIMGSHCDRSAGLFNYSAGSFN
jgi:hypothetical protein